MVCATLVSLLALALGSAAQDLWILPAAESGDSVELIARSGRVPEAGRVPALAGLRGRVVGPDTVPAPVRWRPVAGRTGLVARVPGGLPGARTGWLEDGPTPATLSSPQLEALARSGALQPRQARLLPSGEGLAVVVRRAARTLWRQGGTGGDAWEWRAGLDLELLPLRNPLELGPDRVLALRALRQDRPFAGVGVEWRVRAPDGRTTRGTSRSGPDGVAHVPLPFPGLLSVRIESLEPPPSTGEAWILTKATFCCRIAAP